MISMRIGAALCAALMLFLAGSGGVSAQSVLQTSRGLASGDVTVLVNRAVVVESTQPFVELSVAQPSIADVQPLSDRSIYILGKARGATTLTLLGQNGKLISNVTVHVRPDLAELKERLATLLPGEPVSVRPAATGLVLSGTVSGAAKVARAMDLARAYGGDNVTNMMTVGGTQQVSLKVRVAEMSRDAGKELGIGLNLLGTPGDDVLNFNQTSTASAFGTFGALFDIGADILVDIQIDALEDKNFARLLAEPTLVALSGSEAEFLAGGEVPIPTVNDDGEVDVEFKPVGVNVIFTPTVLDEDLINLAVSSEVSSIDPDRSTSAGTAGGGTIFGFSVRRATTTVELRDGQSFAIAGLYQDGFDDAVAQVPLLGDVPVLGTLFRSTSYQKNETELVIIVTVNLVTPVDDGDALALPTDRIQVPNERELFLMGNTVAGERAGFLATQDFDGHFGYVVE